MAVNVWDGTRELDAVVDGEEIWWRTDYEGLNATAGVMLQRPGSPLRVGVMARSAFTLELEYDDRFGYVELHS